jgi:hypothetical protein
VDRGKFKEKFLDTKQKLWKAAGMIIILYLYCFVTYLYEVFRFQ